MMECSMYHHWKMMYLDPAQLPELEMNLTSKRELVKVCKRAMRFPIECRIECALLVLAFNFFWLTIFVQSGSLGVAPGAILGNGCLASFSIGTIHEADCLKEEAERTIELAEWRITSIQNQIKAIEENQKREQEATDE